MKTNLFVASAAVRYIGIGLLMFLCFTSGAYAQFCIGVGAGSERLRPDNIRQWAPNLDVQYIAENMRVVGFLDFARFVNQIQRSSGYMDDRGTHIPYDENFKSSHLLTHLGFKALVTGDADKKAPIFFAGGELVHCFSFNSYSVKGTDPDHPFSSEEKNLSNGFGIGVLAGFQYYLKPVILQLKGDLDFLPLQITTYNSSSPIHTNTRLTILVPLKQL